MSFVESEVPVSFMGTDCQSASKIGSDAVLVVMDFIPRR